MGKLQFNPLSEQVTVGGHTLTVTALPLGVLRRVIAPLGDKLKNGLSNIGPDPELFDIMLKCTHQSISKADPDITVEDLENSLIMADMLELFQAVVEVSGLTRGSNAGEAPSPESQSSSGDGSTGTSLQQQGGDTAMLTGV